MNARQLRLTRWSPGVAFFILLTAGLQASGHTPGEVPHETPHQHLVQGQVVDATRTGEPVALDSGWRFHSGDDPQWSSPTFDDSTWQSFDPQSGINDQHFTNMQGFVWLRIHVRLSPAHVPLSLLLDRVGNTYQVFANGQSIGNYGHFGSFFGYLLPATRVFPLRDAASGDTLVLAFRFWAPKHRSIAIIRPRTVWIGPVKAIESLRTAIRSTDVIFQFDDIVVALLGLLIGCGLVCLFLAERAHREYLWAGISLALIGLYYAAGVLGTLAVLPLRTFETIYVALGYASIVASIEFLYRFIGQRPGVIVRIYQLAALACACLGALAFYGVVSNIALNITAGVMIFSYAVLSAVLLVVWYMRGKREAAILLMPVVLFGLALPLDFFSYVVYRLGWTRDPNALIPDLHLGPVHFIFSSIALCLYMLSFVLILGSRFLFTNREQERAAAELTAAHRVQSRLVPVTFPALRGFSMEAAYVAANEVGGDFYQAFPEANGGLLFFIGDVSGKGLSAAMIGTLIMGAIRTLAVQQLSPARSLTLLNQQLVGQTDDGFVTCLCARISATGSMIISNAGHLAPYLDGVEMDLANGLPLGITSMADYTEQTVDLPPSARLTFISDGVVEATNARHELLGFARTQQLSVLPAAAIARAAQAHGQADDITVVTIQCTPAVS
jgi:sigma-B regulation protein RsbU (phosphoserine phosphatase)